MVESHFAALLPIYLDEATERLGSLEQAVDALLAVPTDTDAWGAVKQTAHALAGNSAMLGLVTVAQTARAIEQRALAVQESLEPARADALFVDRGYGALRCLIECVARRTGAASLA